MFELFHFVFVTVPKRRWLISFHNPSVFFHFRLSIFFACISIFHDLCSMIHVQFLTSQKAFCTIELSLPSKE
jgi:hypothetical protein